MSFLAELREKAKRDPKRIVLPEGEDERVVEAARIIKEANIAVPIVIKKNDKTAEHARLVDEFSKMRRARKKDMTKKEIEDVFAENNVYAAAMMVRLGLADSFVAGSVYKTSQVARAALGCFGVQKEIGVMSGAFIMEVPESDYGQDGVFVFSDCAIVPFPTKEQLAAIAVSAARFARKILSAEPRVALLSYSTKGSAKGENIDNIREAAGIARRLEPGIEIDGELQVDSSLDKEAATAKASLSASKVAGKANCLIFPNLDSGNIVYKLIQRLARARAVGPLLLGLDRPCSDLSRACSVDDIVDTVAVTGILAK